MDLMDLNNYPAAEAAAEAAEAATTAAEAAATQLIHIDST